MPFSTKPNSRVTTNAIIFIVTKDTDSCFAIVTRSIKPFFVAVGLQGALGTNKRLPRVTTQWGEVVVPVSDQWM